MEANTLQGQSPPPPNFPSIPDPTEGIQNLPSRQQAITARPHTGTYDTCRILPSWTSSGTATTMP